MTISLCFCAKQALASDNTRVGFAIKRDHPEREGNVCHMIYAIYSLNFLNHCHASPLIRDFPVCYFRHAAADLQRRWLDWKLSNISGVDAEQTALPLIANILRYPSVTLYATWVIVHHLTMRKVEKEPFHLLYWNFLNPTRTENSLLQQMGQNERTIRNINKTHSGKTFILRTIPLKLLIKLSYSKIFLAF